MHADCVSTATNTGTVFVKIISGCVSDDLSATALSFTLDSFVDFDAIYDVCLFTWLPPPGFLFFRYSFFLTYLLPYLHFSMRIGRLHFQAGGRKRQPNLSF